MKRTILVVSMALSVPQVARAEDQPENDDAAIVVTGKGLRASSATPAYALSEVDAARLNSASSGRIEDSLSAVAGFQQFRRSDSRSANPSAQGVTLRALGGNASSRSLVLLDGVPVVDPFFGFIPLSALAPERLGRARVIRGGGTGAFGSGAVAGTIELDSAEPESLGLFSGQAMLNDRAESELSGQLAPRLGQGFAVLGLHWDRGQGFWTTPVAQRNAASVRAAYQGWSASLRGVAPLGPAIELQTRALLYRDARTLRFQGANSTSSGEDASLRLVGKGRWQFEALAYLQARNFSNVVISATALRKTLDQRATPSTGWGGKIELRPPLGAGQLLRLGTDWRISQGTMYEDAYSAVTGLVTARRRAGGTNRDIGLFAEYDQTLGNLVLTGGLRADAWAISDGHFQETNAAGLVTTDNRFSSRHGWEWSGRGGALFHAAGGLDLRSSVYSGLRQPTLNELYRPFTVFPVTTRANPLLVNERLFGFEAGFDLRGPGGMTLSATAFDNRVRHAVANVTIGPNLRERRNVDAIHAQGIELGLSAQWHAFTLDGSLAWTRARVEASPGPASLDGLRPAQTPKLAATARISWVPARDWLVALGVRHIGAQFEDDLETDVLPAATTVDAFAQVPLARGLVLILRGENLGDARVVTRNQAGSIDLGTPRTIWAGFRISIGR